MNTMSATTAVRPENLNAPATPKQLWALFCATKKDYRSENLTRVQAAELLSNLNANRPATKSTKDNLKTEMLDYFKKNVVPTVVASLKEAINMESVLVEDTSLMKGTGTNGEAKTYKFRGFGCSISYLTYDKRSKLAAKIEETFRSIRRNEIVKMVCNEFPISLQKQLKNEGTPIEALLYQDYDVNSTLFWGLVRFAKEKGVKKIDYVTRLD